MLGASAVLSNGTVLSRAGSAAVAMTAHASSKPVLVCCEAFKVGWGGGGPGHAGVVLLFQSRPCVAAGSRLWR